MIAIYDPDRLIGGHEVELSCLDPQYYDDWVPFAARAPRAGCAVVVLGNQTTDHRPSRRPGGAGRKWPCAACVPCRLRSDRCRS
jgi:hypothetical protein